MNNNEKLFRLLGWEKKNSRWVPPKPIDVTPEAGKGLGIKTTLIDLSELPDASNSYELCRKYIISEMRERKYRYEIKRGDYFYFIHEDEIMRDEPEYACEIEIKDDNVAAALVEAAIEVLEKEEK